MISIASADLPNSGGSFIEPGKYVVEIVRCYNKRSFKSGDAFRVEVKFIQSNNPKHAPESSGTWHQGLESDIQKRMGAGAIKEFICAACGVDPTDARAVEAFKPQIDPYFVSAVSEANSLAGVWVGLETWHKPTQKGKDFTVHTWSPYVEGGS